MIDQWQIAERLLAAALLCGGIGLEREMSGKAAGLRTHALVGLGAALTMIVSQYGFDAVIQPGRVVLDPSRVAAQIVTGIGFLGAGLILQREGGGGVRGLTTAAGIWVCGMIGMACGAGMYVPALITTALVIGLVLVSARFLERRLRARRNSRPSPDLPKTASAPEEAGD